MRSIATTGRGERCRQTPESPESEGALSAERPCQALCRLAREIVAAMIDVPAELMMQEGRVDPDVRHARNMAMYLSHVAFQVSFGAIAEAFRRDRTSVAYCVGRIEDRRDDPRFDALLARMERLAVSFRGAAGSCLPTGEPH